MTEDLKLTLYSKNHITMSPGAPVYYRNIQVGEVIGTKLSEYADNTILYVNIDHRYKSLVRNNSKFWILIL